MNSAQQQFEKEEYGNEKTRLTIGQIILLALEYDANTNQLYDNYVDVQYHLDFQSDQEYFTEIPKKEIFFARIHKIYAVGIASKDDFAFVKTLRLAAKLDRYIISTDYQLVDKDTSRRFFETKVALGILMHIITNMDHDYLKNLVEYLCNLLAQEDKDYFKGVESVLKGKFKVDPNVTVKSTNEAKEYSSIIFKLLENDGAKLPYSADR